MTGQAVSRRYAKALIELAQQEGRVDEVGDEIAGMAAQFESSPELRNLMFSPGIGEKEVKRGILMEMIRRGEMSDLSSRFLQLLLDKDRTRYIEAISVSYREFADELNNRIRAEIRSAFALSTEDEEALRTRLSVATGKNVILEIETDSSLLGGIKCPVGELDLGRERPKSFGDPSGKAGWQSLIRTEPQSRIPGRSVSLSDFVPAENLPKEVAYGHSRRRDQRNHQKAD